MHVGEIDLVEVKCGDQAEPYSILLSISQVICAESCCHRNRNVQVIVREFFARHQETAEIGGYSRPQSVELLKIERIFDDLCQPVAFQAWCDRDAVVVKFYAWRFKQLKVIGKQLGGLLSSSGIARSDWMNQRRPLGGWSAGRRNSLFIAIISSASLWQYGSLVY